MDRRSLLQSAGAIATLHALTTHDTMTANKDAVETLAALLADQDDVDVEDIRVEYDSTGGKVVAYVDEDDGDGITPAGIGGGSVK